jgi:non-homologous end joining protein Ku
MAPRANWKGYLKLSLVSCAVTLSPATTTRDRVRFNVINRETGHRVHHGVVDADTGEEVPQEEQRGSSSDTRRSKARKRTAPRRSAPKPKKLKRAS